MRFIADLHIHSKYSRATSRDMVLETLVPWAKVKGISLLATGDFTHPEWLFLMKERLEPMGNGFLKLKNGTAALDAPPFRGLPALGRPVAFILSSEISFIYSKGGQVRKIHVMLLAPDFESVERINRRLQAVGNLASDGRPILGLDVRLFCRMVAETAPRAVVIPSHIWTPWFSLFGANSGFDTIEECFEEMTPSIFALETGLSSDPSMNRRLSALDRFALVSNSDAHGPSKIGREANVFETEFSYRGLMDALRANDPARFLYTVEFFPEEGKYHYDGHRKCGVVSAPRESLRANDVCPKCGKKLTIGVLHRVEELADREPGAGRPGPVPYKNLIPLNEIIAEALGKTPECQGVWDLYFRFIREFGDEHAILTEVPAAELARISPEKVAEGIDRMRRGQVAIAPGHDGEYGRIRLFGEGLSPDASASQLSLF
ncbi:MAG TPA: endonuclease Q family protein [Candidatus Aminicenantes bacterium]|nr:endonuclease Q family protein [Candidatus Aminicenantes bacterium]HRY63788.1 endonuclease Q family protein [Candidatus Aminicenantes bacterium]HRZ70701.1 endonuclease Q family protein [Candidatus Aminicenantes bacterium]